MNVVSFVVMPLDPTLEAFEELCDNDVLPTEA